MGDHKFETNISLYRLLVATFLSIQRSSSVFSSSTTSYVKESKLFGPHGQSQPQLNSAIRVEPNDQGNNKKFN